MKTITRNHEFENKLTMIKQGEKYLYGYWEKSENINKIERNEKRDKLFIAEDFEALAEEFCMYDICDRRI